jgi:hypothetical protein
MGWLAIQPVKGARLRRQQGMDPRNALERPLTNVERRSYERSLSDMRRASTEAELPEWEKLQATAEPQIDASGHPFLKTEMDGHTVLLGLSRGNALRLSAPPELTQQLVLTRLEHELKSGKPARASRRQIESDWKLLQRAVEAREAELNAPR